MRLSRAECLAAAAAAAVLALCGLKLRHDLPGGDYTVTAQHPPRPEPSYTPRAYVPDAPVDLNTAGPEELALLVGIGQTKAQAILDYRRANGPFTAPEDLLQVPGIGPATLEALRPHITLSQP